MKRKFADRDGEPREYDPEDASGRQRRYPHEWLEGLPADSGARKQHERLLGLHERLYELIGGNPRLQEYFDTGPVDGSGFRDLYSEHAPAYADGSYPTDLPDWADMLRSIVGLVDLDFEPHNLDSEDEEEDPFYFSAEERALLRAPLGSLESDIAAFIESLA